jgi:hypothetical protein
LLLGVERAGEAFELILISSGADEAH